LTLSLHDEHPDFWVFSKPSGISVNDNHNSSGFIALQKHALSVSQIHPVHRLDEGTSGLLLAAKHTEANRLLSIEFQNQRVEKVYVAVVRANPGTSPNKKQGWITGDMKPQRGGSWKLMRSRGNPATTYFQTESIGDRYRIALLAPKTGRTHQLRVAMKANATPIVGDERYGGEKADRLYLHACYLAFSYGEAAFQFTLPPEQKGLFAHIDQADFGARLAHFLHTSKR